MLPCFPTKAYLPANQGLLTPQLTPVWKPSNACLSSCKASLSSIRFICLNRSALHCLPLSSPIPVAAGSSSQHRKKNLSFAAFISCGDERSGQRTSRGLRKPPLADSDGSGSDKDSCVILQSSGNGGAAILCCKMEEKDSKMMFLNEKHQKDFAN
ncbi:conserved domain protein [Prevotella denticola CRIS 18C-A]|uniref:Conserved domain protein n=1 Tax=Prevotella denticola CRIS 18C-A TaxID=944557 RepID=F0H7R0_9BACT|nr:conserved domain protein [Prevotella denticola CRIS 18C-A]